MPINVEWDNEERTIIRYDIRDPWHLPEYSRALFHTWSMIESVEHSVHVVVDFTHAMSFPRNLLSNAASTNNQLHPRQGLVIGIKVSPYLQMMVRVATRVFPRLGHNVFFVATLQDAYTLIKTYEARQQ